MATQAQNAKTLLDALADAAFLTDKQGRVTKNNRRHSIMTGFSFEELKGHG